MKRSRRDFLKTSSTAIAWMAGLRSAYANASQVSSSLVGNTGDTDSVAFWDQFFNPPKPSEGTVRGGSRGQAKAATPGSQIEYVHLGPSGLRYVQDIKPEELSPLGGDVMLSVSPAQFHFGTGDSSKDRSDKFLHSAQLRFDIHQSQRFLDALPLLAWTSLAAIFPEKGDKLPTLQKLDFITPSGDSAVDKILLPAGMGTVAVNVSTVKKASTLYTVLQDVAKAAKVLTPVLGLPAISLVALEAFTYFYAQVEQHTTFLLSSGPASVAVTQDAWNSPDRAAQALPFPPGDYLLYPKEHAALIKPEFDKLTIENGYAVRTDADHNLPITDRAEQAAKGVTYVTMHLSVSKVNLALADKTEDDDKGKQSTKPRKKKP